LHRFFVECARSFWKAPFLFAEDLTPIEKQKNILQAESMCIEAVSGAVRSLLPVKNILRDYLDEDSEEEEVPVSKKKKVIEPESSSSEDEAPPKATLPFSATAEDEDLISETIESISEPAATATAVAAVAEPAPVQPAPVILEKLETPPEEPKETISNHEIKDIETKSSIINVEKAMNENPPHLMIDTEPSVHFTPYDTVYDENTPNVSEIRYNEKISIEDKPSSNWGIFDDDDDDEVPKLHIDSGGSSLGMEEIEDLDGPVIPTKNESVLDDDIDAPLGASLDFETIA
jgi:hypothetical protein